MADSKESLASGKVIKLFSIDDAKNAVQSTSSNDPYRVIIRTTFKVRKPDYERVVAAARLAESVEIANPVEYIADKLAGPLHNYPTTETVLGEVSVDRWNRGEGTIVSPEAVVSIREIKKPEVGQELLEPGEEALLLPQMPSLMSIENLSNVIPIEQLRRGIVKVTAIIPEEESVQIQQPQQPVPYQTQTDQPPAAQSTFSEGPTNLSAWAANGTFNTDKKAA